MVVYTMMSGADSVGAIRNKGAPAVIGEAVAATLGLLLGGTGAWWASAYYAGRRYAKLRAQQEAREAEMQRVAGDLARQVAALSGQQATRARRAADRGTPLKGATAAERLFGALGKDNALTFDDQTMARLKEQADATGITVDQQIRLLLVRGVLVADAEGGSFKIRWRHQGSEADQERPDL